MLISNYEQEWKKVIKYIEDRVSVITYKTFFEKLNVIKLVDNVFIIETDIFVKDNIENNNKEILDEAINKVLGENYHFFIKLEGEDIDYDKISAFVKASEKKSEVKEIKKNHINQSPLNPDYTFDEFVVGSNNQMATAAAKAVAKAPGTEYNPLFLYGPVGIGKTHLIQAIANEMIRENKEKVVTYVTSETFTNELIDSLQNNTMRNFRDKYRESDILIIDDIQFIAGKASTQEEFFHTFNHLYSGNKQIVIASDRQPSDISKLEERIESRFNQGLICDIQIPDFETRVAILKKKSDADNLDLSNDILTFMANNLKSNIREYEGALKKIKAYSKLTSIKINLEMVKELLKNLIDAKEIKYVDIHTIKKIVCRYFDVTVADIDSKSRSSKYLKPRQIAMYLSREILNLPLATIGKEFGNRDHTTVMNSCKKVTEEINKNINTKRLIDKIVEEIKGEK